ncbi:hypothetical protein HOY80DRAFT_890526 [Tuber brumale]|nr:hypothetical protein HOY80DRAFT_890526 [Tuber brumale]
MLIHGFSGTVHLYKYNTEHTEHTGIRVLYSTAPDTFQSSPTTSPLQVPCFHVALHSSPRPVSCLLSHWRTERRGVPVGQARKELGSYVYHIVAPL